MFNITFRKLNGERSLLDKSNAFITGGSNPSLVVSGVLKEQSSIINPVVLIQADTTIMEYNYAEIDTFKRKYFITDIKNVRNDLWEVYLHVDVLYTYWESALKWNYYFVERNQYDYNALLPDKCNTFKPIKKTTSNSGRVPYNFKQLFTPIGNDNLLTACNVVLRVISVPSRSFISSSSQGDGMLTGTPTNIDPCYAGNPNTYVITAASAYHLFAELASNSEAASYLISAAVLPFSVIDVHDSVDGSWTSITEIPFGGAADGDPVLTIQAVGFRFNAYGGFFKETCDIPIDAPDDYAAIGTNKIVDLWLPVYGHYSVSLNDLYSQITAGNADNSISIQYTVNLTTFTCSIFICMKGVGNTKVYPIDVLNCDMFASIPFSVDNSDRVTREETRQAVNMVASVLGSVVAVIASGGVLAAAEAGSIAAAAAGASVATSAAGGVAAVANGITGIATLQKTNTPMQSTSKASDLYHYATMCVEWCIYDSEWAIDRNDDYRSLVGMPCFKLKGGNEIYGFSVISEVHLYGLTYATTEEEVEIMKLLKEGVHFPPPPEN